LIYDVAVVILPFHSVFSVPSGHRKANRLYSHWTFQDRLIVFNFSL
jgi:hypothetical protein